MENSIKKILRFKAQEINMRDPFIFADKKKSLYYLFGTTSVCDGAANIDPFFEVYVSPDLNNFEGPYAAFMPEKGFWGTKHFWAPEVYEYNNRYYMFATCKGGIGEDRGTCVLTSDSPGGPYKDYSYGHITLKGHECLDGTLYMDESGRPWMAFCHEWTEIYYGKICAIPLNEKLLPDSFEQVEIVNTKTDNLPWIRKMHDPRVDKTGYLTDAPFFYRAKSGALLMLWSSYAINGYQDKGYGGYVVAVARSENGKITGPWRHERNLLLDRNIGHCSLFRNFSGELILCGHANDTAHGTEYPVFIPLIETHDGFVI